MNHNTAEKIDGLAQCYQFGHAPPEVTHLPGHVTLITCSRCRKTVREVGLSDHPDAAK